MKNIIFLVYTTSYLKLQITYKFVFPFQFIHEDYQSKNIGQASYLAPFY